MSKCLRRYYSYEKKKIVNEVCEFTNSNYKLKFQEWLKGEYIQKEVDKKLTNRGIVAFVSNKYQDFKEWISLEEPMIWEVIDEYEGWFETIYIKGDMVFCKVDQKGVPTTLSKDELKFLQSYIIKHEKRVKQMEEESLSEDLDLSNEENLVEKRIELLEEINQYYATLDELCNQVKEKCNKAAKEVQAANPELMPRVKEWLEKMIQESDEPGRYEQFLLDYVSKALENTDDLFNYMVAYNGCMDVVNGIEQGYKDNIKKLLKAYTCIRIIPEHLQCGDFLTVEEDRNDIMEFVHEIEKDESDENYSPEDPRVAAKKMYHIVEMIRKIDEMILRKE